MTREVAVVAMVCGIGAGCEAPRTEGGAVETQHALALSRSAPADTGVAPAQKVAGARLEPATPDGPAAATTTASPRVGAGADLTVSSGGTPAATVGSIDTPGLYPLLVTADSVTIPWTDRSTTELRFTVYRRDAQGNWHDVYTVPTIDMAGSGSYLWVDTNKSLSAQCYYVAAVNDQIQAGSPERCTVRPDPAVFPQSAPPEVQDWDGLSSKNDTAAPLKVRGSDRFLQHEDRTFGVSLGWTGASQDNVKIERQGTSPLPLMTGEAVAIRVWGGGWLAHGTQSFGVDLVLSDTPAYEWYVLSGAPAGAQIYNEQFALWNKSAHDYLVPGDQTWGIGLNWYQKTFPPVYPASPPPHGVKTFVLTNCHTEERPVEIWVADLTAGSGYVDRGRLESNWSSTGCPTVGIPWTFTPTSGHSYDVRAIDFSAPGCDNAPLDESSCVRFDQAFTGDASGVVLTRSVNN